jgi:hypothetical protein
MKKNAEGKFVYPLKKPVTAHGEQVSELLLAEPDTKLVMELGYPYLGIASDNGAGVQLQPKVAARYLSRLAQVPMSTIEQIAIPDLHELHGWLMGFFGEGE